MRRRHFVALAVVVLSLFVAQPVAALAQMAGNIAIQPTWVNVNGVSVYLSFSGTTANCDASISALSGTIKISATITLERKNTNGTYSSVKTWTTSADKTSLNFTGSYDVTKGYTYRVTVTATVIRNGVSETVSNWTEGWL